VCYMQTPKMGERLKGQALQRPRGKELTQVGGRVQDCHGREYVGNAKGGDVGCNHSGVDSKEVFR